MTYYIIRFDDINPKMNWARFNKLKSIINRHKIKSILGVIPNCKDNAISKYNIMNGQDTNTKKQATKIKKNLKKFILT